MGLVIESEEVELGWRLLEARSIGPGEVRIRRLDPDHGEDGPALGVDETGNRHLLLPVSEEAPVEEDRTSAGVHVLDNRWEYEGKSQRYVDVECRKPHLSELFSVIVLDILAELDDSQAPDVVAREALARWRELLRRDPSALPSVAQLTGIFGELTVLHELVSLNHSLVPAWKGPQGHRHDIVTEAGAVEVKSTIRRSDWTVEIHGLDQLDPPASGALLLVVLRVEQHPSTGRSVPDLADAITEKGGNRELLLEKLEQAGVRQDMLSALRTIRFVNRERRSYHVTEDFPRLSRNLLVSGDAPPEVVEVDYRLDLNAVPQLSDEEATSMLERVAG